MMVQIKMDKLIISLICCVVVACFNVPNNPITEIGASTLNPAIRGQEQTGVTTQRVPLSTQFQTSGGYKFAVSRLSYLRSSIVQCANGTGSVNGTRLCDGRIDCPDSSDENTLLCYGTACNRTFPCLNGRCVALNSPCDMFNDCGDDSDEDSTMCGESSNRWGIVCANGQVLKGDNLLCNGIYNCMEKSDEFNCPKCPGGLSCDRGRRCVKKETLCDGIQDCYDGADESCLSPFNQQRCNVGDFICPTGICVPEGRFISGNRCWGSQVLTAEDIKKYCKPPNLLCDGGSKCIPPQYRCDGKLDCQDGTDEMSPNKNVMSGPSYKCGNGFCVPYLALCNNTDECGDNSDEDFGNGQCPFSAVNCSSVANPSSLYYQCDNNLCVPSFKVDDSINNCGDFSDEKNSTMFHFQCSNGKKLLRSFLCDGRDNCGDNSDETDWSCTVNSTRPICPQQSCPSGRCIHHTDVCDGFNDCEDHSDERSCPPKQTCRQHTCPSGKCINLSDVCDGVNDCGDNSDETGCSCLSFDFKCTSGQCIASYLKCNGVKDCSDNSDEIGCSKSPCFGHTCPSGTCILSSQMCDGFNDCGDNSDETDWTCTNKICSGHTCLSGKCILYSDVCNGKNDCGDNSDESYCYSTYYYSTHIKVAAGVSVPVVFIVIVGGCFGFRRRRMLTTIRTARAQATFTRVATIANNLPPSYSQAVGPSEASQGFTNPGYVSSTSVSNN